MKTSTLPEVEDEVTEADGKAHYVRTKALLVGGPVTALCGKRYVPTVIAEAMDRPACAHCVLLYLLLGDWDA